MVCRKKHYLGMAPDWSKTVSPLLSDEDTQASQELPGLDQPTTPQPLPKCVAMSPGDSDELLDSFIAELPKYSDSLSDSDTGKTVTVPWEPPLQFMLIGKRKLPNETTKTKLLNESPQSQAKDSKRNTPSERFQVKLCTNLYVGSNVQ